MNEGKWVCERGDCEVWSLTDEHETREMAIDAAPDELSLEPGEAFQTGQLREVRPSLNDVERFVEAVSESAYDRCGESSDEWPDVTEGRLARLHALMVEAWDRWVGECGVRRLYSIEHVEDHVAPDVAE